MQRSKPLTPSTISADNCSKLRRSHCVLGFSTAKNRNSICDFGSIYLSCCRALRIGRHYIFKRERTLELENALDENYLPKNWWFRRIISILYESTMSLFSPTTPRNRFRAMFFKNIKAAVCLFWQTFSYFIFHFGDVP